MIYKKFILFCIAFNVTLLTLSAQDLHYSQFYNAPLAVNPALTGIFNGDKRVSVSLRDQWRTVSVPWFTMSLGYDMKIYPKKSNKTFFGAGAHFNFDRQGDSNLSLLNLNLSGSVTRILTENHLITGGLMLGFANRGFDFEELTWDNQFVQGVGFDQTIGSGENFDFENVSFLESALGLNYRYQKTARTKLDLGIGAFHLINANTDYVESNRYKQKLPIRLSLYGIGTIQLTERLDLQLDALYQRQDAYEELLFGGYVDIYLDQSRGKEKNLHLGIGYRTSGSLYPKLAFEWQKRFFIAASWDIELSQFGRDHQAFGPEVHFNYLITDVKPPKIFKVCPIF